MTTGLIRSWWQYNDNNDKVDDDEKWLCGKLMGVQDFHQAWPPIIVSPRSMSLLLNGKNGDHGDDDDHGGDDEYNHHDDYASWHWWCLGARLWGNVCWSDKVSLLRLSSTSQEHNHHHHGLIIFPHHVNWSLWVEIIIVKIITLIMIIMIIIINLGAHTSGCKESGGGG